METNQTYSQLGFPTCYSNTKRICCIMVFFSVLTFKGFISILTFLIILKHISGMTELMVLVLQSCSPEPHSDMKMYYISAPFPDLLSTF